jgi:hypothetical protein
MRTIKTYFKRAPFYNALGLRLAVRMAGCSVNVNCGKSVSGETGDIGKSSSSSF